VPAVLTCLAVLANGSPTLAQAQHLANPSYFYPGQYWKQLEAAAPIAGLAIMNPNSGSGTALNTDYVTEVKTAQEKGIAVIGYVDTAYAKRSPDLVAADIKNYFTWYHVDGIFFDEASNSASDVPYYKTCYQLVHGLDSKATVVLNPGTPTDEGYMKAADIIVTFESIYTDYVNNFVQAPWVTSYPPRRFWHIVLGTTTVDDLQKAISLSKSRNAGWFYATTYAPPANPYDTLPTNPYWHDELTWISQK